MSLGIFHPHNRTARPLGESFDDAPAETMIVSPGGGDPATAITDPCSASADKLPLSTESSLTLAVQQQQVNPVLTQNGYAAIAADGKLGPATCGAMRLVDQIANAGLMCQYGGNCVSYTTPSKASSASAPSAIARPSSSTPLLLAPKKPAISQATMMTGGIVLLAAAGLYYYAKKKGMV